MTTTVRARSWWIPARRNAAARRTVVSKADAGGRDDCDAGHRALPDRDRRRRPGRPRGRPPPGEEGTRLRDPRRRRSDRRLLAQALAVAAPVLAGQRGRVAGDAVSGSLARVPERARHGRLPRSEERRV